MSIHAEHPRVIQSASKLDHWRCKSNANLHWIHYTSMYHSGSSTDVHLAKRLVSLRSRSAIWSLLGQFYIWPNNFAVQPPMKPDFWRIYILNSIMKQWTIIIVRNKTVELNFLSSKHFKHFEWSIKFCETFTCVPSNVLFLFVTILAQAFFII